MNDIPVVAEWLMEGGCNYIYAMVDDGKYLQGPDWMWAVNFVQEDGSEAWNRGYGVLELKCGYCGHEATLVCCVGTTFDLECSGCGHSSTIDAFGWWDEEPNDGVWL